jgi:hypothetical protein
VVFDPDVALNVGENFTFAITGGNTGASWGVDPFTGQLSVVNGNTAAMRFPDGTAASPGFFNLTVTVQDAGTQHRISPDPQQHGVGRIGDQQVLQVDGQVNGQVNGQVDGQCGGELHGRSRPGIGTGEGF